MATRFNTNLLSVRLLLLVYYGGKSCQTDDPCLFFLSGLGCAYPFIITHFRSFSMTWEDMKMLSALFSFSSLVFVSLATKFVDKYEAYKVFLIVCFVLTALAYSFLLYAPSFMSGDLQPPQLEFYCNPEDAVIVAQKCSSECPTPLREVAQSYRIRKCETSCSTQGQVSYESLCFYSSNKSTECHMIPLVLGDENVTEEVILHTSLSHYYTSGDSHCIYPLTSFAFDGQNYSRLQCSKKQCVIKCKVIASSPDGFLYNSTCRNSKQSNRTLFWTYVSLRSTLEILISTTIAILDLLVLKMISIYESTYGRQLLWGLVGLGLFGCLSGYLLDQELVDVTLMQLGPPIYSFAVLMASAVILVCFLPLKSQAAATKQWKSLWLIFMSFRFVLFYSASVVMGTLHGYLKTYLFWYLQDMQASNLIFGLMLTAASISSLPFMFCSQRIISFCGTTNLIAVGLLLYSLRLLGYAFVRNPWYSLPLETFEAFSLYVFWVMAVSYIKSCFPRELTTAGVVLLHLTHYGLGRGLGSFFGGFFISKYGFRQAWRGAAIISLGLCIAVLTIYQIFLKIRRYKRKLSYETSRIAREHVRLTMPNHEPLNYVG